MGEWAGKLLEWMVSAAAESVGINLEHVKKQALARIADHSPWNDGPSANHDLLRAVRLAWIAAAFWVLKEAMQRVEGPDWADRRAEARRFEAVLRDTLLALRQAAFDRRTHPGDSAIDASVQAVLEGVPEFISPGGRSQPGRVLTDRFEATLSALTGWPQAEIPPLFGQVARRGLPTHGNGPLRDFGELVFADFAETVKDPQRYPQASQAFHVAMLAMARELAQATLAAVRGLDARLDAALPQIDALVLLQRGIGQQLQQVAVQLDAVASAVDQVPEATVALLMQRLQSGGWLDSARSAGVDQQTVIALARRLSPGEVNNFDQAVRELERAVAIASEVLARGGVAEAAGHDAFVSEVLARVAEQTRSGRLDEGTESVDDALAELQRMEDEQRAALQRSRRSLLEAGLQQDLLRRDAFAAARRLEALCAQDGDPRPVWSAGFLQRQQAFFDEGADLGVTLSLAVAVEMARRMAAAAASDDERHQALDRLGTALFLLGQRRKGTAALDEAVEAHRQVLASATAETAPQAWARAQYGLGRVLFGLGDRLGRSDLIEAAIAAQRASLQLRTRAAQPLDWAAGQHHLGVGLWLLGLRRNDRDLLVAAIDCYRQALTERTRRRVPRDWAGTQNRLGIALTCLGRMDGDAQEEEQAVAAYRQALSEQPRDRVPFEWAATQNNLAIALAALGHRRGAAGAAELGESAAAYSEALTVWTRERVPLDWACLQHNLGGALHWLGAIEAGTESLQRAVLAFRSALQEFPRDSIPLSWAAAQCDLGSTLRTLGQRLGDADLLEQAVAAQRLALLERTRERVPMEWAVSQAALGECLYALAGHAAAPQQHLEQAVEACGLALEVLSAAANPDEWRQASEILASARRQLAERTATAG